MDKKRWQVANNDFFLRDVTSEVEKLTNGVYKLLITPLGELYVQKVSEKFEFDFKVYGLESDFVQKAIKTYKNTKGNLGVLLNGIKGTGKTITAEVIANKLELPVILVNANYGGLNNFLSSINQDVVVFVDEYEKVFKGNISEDDYDYNESNSLEGGTKSGEGDSTLLSLMDGTYKTIYRKVFLLTTNKTWINDNMLNRPGRIRYLKNFGDLALAQINEIIDDCLVDKKMREVVIEYLKPLKIITVDIVKTVISEVNIYKVPPSECCKELNVEFKDVEYSLIKLPKRKGDKEEIISRNIQEKQIAHILSNKFGRWEGKYIPSEEAIYYLAEKPDYINHTYVVNESGVRGKNPSNFKVRLKKESATHKSFMVF